MAAALNDSVVLRRRMLKACCRTACAKSCWDGGEFIPLGDPMQVAQMSDAAEQATGAFISFPPHSLASVHLKAKTQ